MRPKDAATLILLRDRRQVLLGVRNAGHVFMPHRYVFPGGRVDAGDSRVPCPVPLAKETRERLSRSVSEARGRALAMAAVRETWEESGLIVGHSCARPPRTRSPHWQGFYSAGFVPALDKLEYIGRAITPPGGVRRFDARFFLADASHSQGELVGNGELGDLAWVDLEQATELPLALITKVILQLLQERFLGSGYTDAGLAAINQLYVRELPEYYPTGSIF